MMFKKTFVLLSLFLLSLSAHATRIAYNGYSLNTDTHVVTGGGLEWLQWTQTDREGTIAEVLSEYTPDGWRLASNLEMANLMNHFNFGTTFLPDEEVSISSGYVPLSRRMNKPYFHFMDLFGVTGVDACGFDDCEVSMAIYGSDDDGDDRLKHVTAAVERAILINDNDREQEFGFVGTQADYYHLNSPFNDSDFGTGLALVREVIPVSEPAWGCVLSVAGLAIARRRKRVGMTRV